MKNILVIPVFSTIFLIFVSCEVASSCTMAFLCGDETLDAKVVAEIDNVYINDDGSLVAELNIKNNSEYVIHILADNLCKSHFLSGNSMIVNKVGNSNGERLEYTGVRSGMALSFYPIKPGYIEKCDILLDAQYKFPKSDKDIADMYVVKYRAFNPRIGKQKEFYIESSQYKFEYSEEPGK